MNWNSLEIPANPYYMDDDVVIYHGDCREILPTLPKVDLVLTDPPYIGLRGGHDAFYDRMHWGDPVIMAHLELYRQELKMLPQEENNDS